MTGLADEIPRCARCGRYFELLADTVRGPLCAECWHRWGEPTAMPVDPGERERRRQETARRMQKRKGNAAYLVRSGKAGL